MPNLMKVVIRKKAATAADKSLSSQGKITAVANSIRDLVLEKNQRYGDAALNPLKIFSKLDAGSSIQIRLDDKLSRIINGDELRKNDVADVLGYLILLCASKGWLDFSDLID
jgi:hypothetical protein